MDIDKLSTASFSVELNTCMCTTGKHQLKHSLNIDSLKHWSFHPNNKLQCLDPYNMQKCTTIPLQITSAIYKYQETEYKFFYEAIVSGLLDDKFKYVSNQHCDMKICVYYKDLNNVINMWNYFETIIMKFVSVVRRVYCNTKKNLENFSFVELVNDHVVLNLPITEMDKEHITGWLGFFTRFVVASEKFVPKFSTGNFGELFEYIDNDELKQYFKYLTERHRYSEYDRLVDISNKLITNSEDISNEDFVAICRNQIISTKILTKLLLNSKNKRLFNILVDITDGSNPNLILDIKYINSTFLRSEAQFYRIQTTNVAYLYIVNKLSGIDMQTPIVPIVYAQFVYPFIKSKGWTNNDFIIWSSVECPINKNVTGLTLSNLSFTPNLENLVNLPNLENILFQKLNIELSDTFCDLRRLTRIIIENCQLKSLPENIGKINDLITLNITGNQVRYLPDSICQLVNLKTLVISTNKINHLPRDIGRLKKLETFNASSNQLYVLPDSLCEMKNLKTLKLDNNLLSSLPNNIGNLQKMYTFHIDSNRLKSLPSSICNLQLLQRLTLANNHINSLPDNIGDMLELVGLNCKNNKLISLPDSIGNLDALEELELSNNNLTLLPNSIGRLKNLEIFDVSNNELITLPESLVNLQGLRVLFDNNPNIELPRRLLHILHSGGVITNRGVGVYADKQNVHATSLQQSIKTSIKRMIEAPQSMNSRQVLEAIAIDPILSQIAKNALERYSIEISRVSEVDVTFLEILTAVWTRIIINKEANDIKSRLNQEIVECETEGEDGEPVCFTGKISRLVNCLQGFDDIVNVGISDAEQIGIIITIVKQRLKDEGQYTVELHKALVKEQLLELKHPQDVIEMWINYISDDDEEENEEAEDVEYRSR
jgi:Leucine-rich repeat (LRR) protein